MSAGGTAVLVLEDGRTWQGREYGAVGTTVGEAVFATGMTGYQETLTDPSYHRQVVVMTAPHIGNTGVNDEDGESERIWVAGYVVRDPARRASSTPRSSSTGPVVAAGSPGPLEKKTPSGAVASTSSRVAVAGSTWTSMPRSAIRRGVIALMPRSTAATVRCRSPSRRPLARTR